MTELAVPIAGAIAAPALPSVAGVAGLESWVTALGHANEIAGFMAHSNFVPMPLRKKGKDSYKTTDELRMDVTAIILAGASIGYDPFQAVQQMFIVHGSPAMYARSMVALVKSHGHKLDRTHADPKSVTVKARHKESAEWHEFTWTFERAQTAGYTSNPKYKTNPIEMLYAKAATEACRVMFPEVLSGISPYSVEEAELEDLGEEPPARTAEAAAPAEPAAAKRTITRTRAQAPAPALPAAVKDAPKEAEPEADPEEAAGVDAETGELADEGRPAALEVDYFEEIQAKAGDVVALRALWRQAQADGQDDDVLNAIASASTAAKN